MLPGEAATIPQCPTCKAQLPVKVCRSNAGFYIGQFCDQCGPYCRISGYYRTQASADLALRIGGYSR
jgi:hypothetical protein